MKFVFDSKLFHIASMILITLGLLHLFTVGLDNKMYRLTVILIGTFTLILFLFFFKEKQGKKSKYPPVSSLPLLLFIVYVYLDTAFGDFNFDALVYHLQYDLGVKADETLVKLAWIYLVAALFMIVLLWILKNKYTKYRFFDYSIAVLLLVVNPINIGAYESINKTMGNNKPSQLFVNYKAPEISLKDHGHRKDLILIYMESVEKAYRVKKLFGEALPNIKNIASEGIDFVHVAQAKNTGWTIAGMVATQCGVPLFPVGLAAKNRLDRINNFMPNAVCLGDVLKQNGYSLSYMGGSNIEFAGKGSFYRQHGFDRVQGKDQLMLKLTNPDLSHWGVHDDDLFELAYAEIKERKNAVNKQPFAFVMLTLDTHQPSGMPSLTCKKKMDGYKDDEMIFAIKCADYLLGKFINQLKKDNLLKDTLLVILSDHLAMENSTIETLKNAPGGRYNNLIALGSENKNQTIRKYGSMLDVYPTILNMLGFGVKNDKAALGVSLLSSNQTLVEKYGIKRLNEMIEKESGLQRKLWEVDN